MIIYRSVLHYRDMDSTHNKCRAREDPLKNSYARLLLLEVAALPRRFHALCTRSRRTYEAFHVNPPSAKFLARV